MIRILLDECMPRGLKRELVGYDCRTVPEAGLAGRKNGELLRLAEQGGFDVLLTVDKGIEREHNRLERRLSLLVVRSRSNAIDDILPLVSDVLAALRSLQPGQVVRIR